MNIGKDRFTTLYVWVSGGLLHRETEISSRTAKNVLGGVCCGVRTWRGNDSRVRPGLQVKGHLEWDRSMNGAWVWRVSPRD